MKHASAVYGVALCTALGLLDRPPVPGSIQELPRGLQEADRAYIELHCGVPRDDVKVMNMYYMKVRVFCGPVLGAQGS